MRREFYDLIAIGSGPAGESAAELATAFGYTSLVIERDKPGGTVTTTGGVPTKTLREAALASQPVINLDELRGRTLDVCAALQKSTYENIVARGSEYLKGEAHLNADRSVFVSDAEGKGHRFHAKMILIATGSRPQIPRAFDFEHPRICDTDSILTRGRLPRDLLIVGGGAVGVEFATIAHALKIPVTIVDRGPHLIANMDGEMSFRIAELFKEWRIEVKSENTIESILAQGDDLRVALSTGEVLTADTVLFAAGRVARTEGLGLKEADVQLDEKGRIKVGRDFQTSVPGVYAAGDVLKPTLASVAMEQGRAAVCHAFGINFEGIVDPTPVSAVYGMPEVAGAGLTEEQCKEQAIDYEVGRMELGETPRGAIAGRGGLLKILFNTRNRKILGVHCLGDVASEVIGAGQMAIRCGATLNTIANMSMATPTYGYAYKYAAFDGLKKLRGRHARS